MTRSFVYGTCDPVTAQLYKPHYLRRDTNPTGNGAESLAYGSSFGEHMSYTM